MRRKRNTAGVPYSSSGRFGAFTVLVAAIVTLALVAAYSDDIGDTSSAGSGGGARLAGRNELVSAQNRPGVPAVQRARAARATRARRAALRRARVAVRRATVRRRAARRAAIRRARRRATVTVVYRTRPYRAYSSVGQNICAPLPRGGGKAARQARSYRKLQRKQVLYNLNLHC